MAGSRALQSADSTEPATLELICAQHEVCDFASGKSPYERGLAHFVRCIATGEESIVKPGDAYEALRISLAATESVVTGEPVTLGDRT